MERAGVPKRVWAVHFVVYGCLVGGRVLVVHRLGWLGKGGGGFRCGGGEGGGGGVRIGKGHAGRRGGGVGWVGEMGALVEVGKLVWGPIGVGSGWLLVKCRCLLERSRQGVRGKVLALTRVVYRYSLILRLHSVAMPCIKLALAPGRRMREKREAQCDC